MWREYVVPADALYFEAKTANSTIELTKVWSPIDVSLETSTDGATWSDYTIWYTITLSNIWDKVYMRNKSGTPTSFGISSASYYKFVMTWSIAAHWSVNYLLCKDSTDTLPNYDATYYCLFNWCTSLTSCPTLPATTLRPYCYSQMFYWCTSLTTIPTLPAISLTNYCYNSMFRNCSWIKLSATQDSNYTQPYRIPTTWTWTAWTYSVNYMFAWTWWTFTWTPTINTTYYTSNQVI
jgi:hypothetical protein